MVPNVSTGDPTMLLCLNCARQVVAPRIRSKYEGLTKHLKFRAAFTSIVKLSFARIDGLIGSNLPMEAYRTDHWWSNGASSAHSKGWLDAGWEVQEVNIKGGFVVFKKVRELPRPPRGRRKAMSMEITQPFTPVPVHPSKREPSKTKVSKLYARILNIERQRKQKFQPPGKPFTPKPHDEKKLFWSEKRSSNQ